MARRRHPFHWNVYSKIYDQLNALASDERVDPDVAGLLAQARGKLWDAWDLQADREKGRRKPGAETSRKEPDANA